VRERRGRALHGSIDLSKCQERLSNPGLGVYILPLPVTSRYGQNAYLADCPRLNSNYKNAKSTAGRTGHWAGRTIRKDPADRSPGPRGLSAGRSRIVRPVHRAPPCSLWFRWIKDRPREARRLSTWKRIFQILNKYQNPADRPPREPGLSAQHLKTYFI
jgi:hypothetical protein